MQYIRFAFQENFQYWHKCLNLYISTHLEPLPNTQIITRDKQKLLKKQSQDTSTSLYYCCLWWNFQWLPISLQVKAKSFQWLKGPAQSGRHYLIGPISNYPLLSSPRSSHSALLCCCSSNKRGLFSPQGFVLAPLSTWITLPWDILLAHSLTLLGLSTVVTSSVEPTPTLFKMQSCNPNCIPPPLLFSLKHFKSSTRLYLEWKKADSCLFCRCTLSVSGTWKTRNKHLFNKGLN